MDERRDDGDVTARTERLARNEAVARDVNEQIEALNDWGAQVARFEVVCECGRGTCSDTIQVDREQYEAVRAHADRFIVTPGHDLPEIERVIARHERYEVVAKRAGAARRVAEESDPRT